MKNFKTTLLAAMAVFFLISCSDDDDAAPGLAFGTGTGQVTVEATNYPLDKGLVFNYGLNTGSDTYNFDIELYSGNLTVNPTTGITGIGNYLYLELHTDQSGGLANGTYTYGNATSNFALTDSELAVDYNFQTDDSSSFFNVNGGTVEVTRNGSNYTVALNLTLSGGSTLTGNYTGNLTAVDVTDL
jgi:hypothetical protein